MLLKPHLPTTWCFFLVSSWLRWCTKSNLAISNRFFVMATSAAFACGKQKEKNIKGGAWGGGGRHSIHFEEVDIPRWACARRVEGGVGRWYRTVPYRAVSANV